MNKKIIKIGIAGLTAITPLVAVVACGGQGHATKQSNAIVAADTQVVEIPAAGAHGSDWGTENFAYPNDTLRDGNNLYETKARNKFGNPFTLHYHNSDLDKWKAGVDADAAFNRGTIPLKNRILAPKIISTQTENKLDILDGLNKSTSNTFNGTTSIDYDKHAIFSMWSNLNSITSWGGSKSEGTVILPKANDINAAHKNGVPIQGTLFIPPETFGGNDTMYAELITKTDGVFKSADNLIAMAKYNGFDGWFLNFEASALNYTNPMKEWMTYFYDKSTEAGLSVQLYEGSSGIGGLLGGTHKWTSFALDYGHANPGYEESKVTYGYNITNGTNGQHIFNDRNVWVYGYAGNHDIPNGAETWDMQFFTSSEGQRDPRIEGTDNWDEPTKTYRQRTVINGHENFTTNFNAGYGNKWVSQGQAFEYENGWRNAGLESVQPTWRYIVDEYNNNDLNTAVNRQGDKVTKITTDNIDWKVIIDENNAAWQGATALHYTGKLGANKTIVNKLYGSNIPVADKDQFNMIYKNINSETIAPDLAVWTDTINPIIIKGQATDVGNGHQKVAYDVSSLVGKTITSFGAAVTNSTGATKSIDLGIGQLQYQANTNNEQIDLKTIKNDGVFSRRDAYYLRMMWETTDDSKIDHYVIYKSNDDTKFNKDTLISISSNPTAYINDIKTSSDHINMIIEGYNSQGQKVLTKNLKANLN